jgi:hypothetical protein
MINYIITGRSALTGERDQLTPPISGTMARDLLAKAESMRRHRRKLAYTDLRVERQDAVQLQITFS